MAKTLRTSKLKKLFGLTNDAELAEYFEISRAAVSKWGGVIPASRIYQLQQDHPGVFDEYRVRWVMGPNGMTWETY